MVSLLSTEVSREQFLASPLEQSYVFHRLVIFGEAINRLAGSFQQKYPALPWPQIIALRNRLVHAYFDLDGACLGNRRFSSG